MQRHGQWLVVGIFTVAIAAAGLSWYWNYQVTHHCLAFLGSEGARANRRRAQSRSARICSAGSGCEHRWPQLDGTSHRPT